MIEQVSDNQSQMDIDPVVEANAQLAQISLLSHNKYYLYWQSPPFGL